VSELRITAIRAQAISFSRTPTTLNANLVSPFSHFPDHAERGRAWWGPAVLTLVEVETDAGITGIGTAGGFTGSAAPIVTDHLAPLLVGTDPFDVELNWSRMYRGTVRYGRRGVAIAAISGIDIACWDIMGKALGVPVYELLGGRTKPAVDAYVSRLYALRDLEELADEARAWKAAGFTMMKQRFGFGPADGIAGMKANEALVRTVRDAVGDEVVLAADAYMGWDLHYALEMERRLRPYGLRWIEEPLLPHDIDGYQRLCRASETLISHGEHEYTRYGFAEIISKRAADLLQPDVNRVGGLTEARKICALASAHDIPVVPHSNEAHNLHLVLSQTTCPFTEYFPDVEPDTGNELFWKLFDGNAVAVDGRVDLTARPGLGITVNESARSELVLSGKGEAS
jgi:L-alanine-DL-glutamate epimerase-like enolase superfamily enzyme